MHPFSNRTYIIEIAYSLAIIQWKNINLIHAIFLTLRSALVKCKSILIVSRVLTFNTTLSSFCFFNHYCLLYINTERRYCTIKMRWRSSSILYFRTKDVYLYTIPIFNESTSCRKHMRETRICTGIGLR